MSANDDKAEDAKKISDALDRAMKGYNGGRGIGQSELARRSGVPQPTINRTLKGKSIPETDTLSKLVSVLGIDAFGKVIASLLSPMAYSNQLPDDAESPQNKQGDSTMPSNVVRLKKVNTESNLVRFELHPERMSAGPGASAEQSYEPVEYMDFTREWALREFGGRNLDRIKIVTCHGNSMSPSIEDGDLMFVDTGVTTFQGEGMYCFEFKGSLLVKRLVVDLVKQTLELRSDNPEYKTAKIGVDEVEQLNICAKVLRVMSVRKA